MVRMLIRDLMINLMPKNCDFGICKEDIAKNPKIISLKKNKNNIITSGFFHL